jgi:hypothetical protein
VFNLTEQRKACLGKLDAISKERGEVKLRPLEYFSVNGKMPHEKDIEIGERIIKKKYLNK